MIGSFHDSTISSRHQSLSGMACEGHIRTNSIDENSSYEDLVKVGNDSRRFFSKDFKLCLLGITDVT